MYTNTPVSTSGSDRDRKGPPGGTPSNTPNPGTPASSPPRTNPQDRRTGAAAVNAAPGKALLQQQQHLQQRWADSTISALEGATAASSPQHGNLSALVAQEKARNRDIQNKKSSTGVGGSSGSGSKWGGRASGGAKGTGRDESKGKETGKEGEKKKGFFQKRTEGLLAREMEQGKANFWRPSG